MLDTFDLFFLLYMQGFPGVADVGKPPPTWILFTCFFIVIQGIRSDDIKNKYY